MGVACAARLDSLNDVPDFVDGGLVSVRGTDAMERSVACGGRWRVSACPPTSLGEAVRRAGTSGAARAGARPDRSPGVCAGGPGVERPGGADSSQDRKPVSASALIARRSGPALTRHSTITAPDWTAHDSLACGTRWEITSSPHRGIAREEWSARAKTRNHNSSSLVTRATPSTQPRPRAAGRSCRLISIAPLASSHCRRVATAPRASAATATVTANASRTTKVFYRLRWMILNRCPCNRVCPRAGPLSARPGPANPRPDVQQLAGPGRGVLGDSDMSQDASTASGRRPRGHRTIAHPHLCHDRTRGATEAATRAQGRPARSLRTAARSGHGCER